MMILRFFRRVGAALLIGALLVLSALPVSAIEPTYTVSDAYMASPFYAALSELSLTGDERFDVLSVALSQLGYHEADGEDGFGGDHVDGSRNFAEYNRMYGKLDNGEGNGLSYGYSWCAAFVSWCLRQSGVDTEVAVTSVSCRRMTDWYREQDAFYGARSGYTPQPGDIIMFHEGDGVPSHVGFVLGVAHRRVYVIDGNGRENSVAIHVYNRNSKAIYGYCVPEYTVHPDTVYDFLSDAHDPIGSAITLPSVLADLSALAIGLTAVIALRLYRRRVK